MLRGIGKTVGRKLAALKGGAEFSSAVRDVIRLLYRKSPPPVRDAVFEQSGRRAVITAAHASGATTLTRDKELIRAAVRREGFDVREVVVK